MAWMRTSVSLYSFGFSITKFMDYLEKQGDVQFSAGARRVGLALIFLGIFALVIAVAEHVKRTRTMKRLGLPSISRVSLPNIAAIALLAIGSTTLIAMVLNSPH